MIKIIKKDSTLTPSSSAAIKPSPERIAATTVAEWILETRRNRRDEDNTSRETIAGWAAEAKM